MKHPKVNQLFVYATYGCALAIGYKNIEMSAIGLAGNNPISDLDWILSVSMATFEFALSGALTTPAFWPILVGTANSAIDRVLETTAQKKYQFSAIAILILFVALLIFSTVQVYYWDVATTIASVCQNPNACTEMEKFKAYGLVFGSECLLAGAGLLSLASGIGAVQYRQINDRIQPKKAPSL